MLNNKSTNTVSTPANNYMLYNKPVHTQSLFQPVIIHLTSLSATHSLDSSQHMFNNKPVHTQSWLQSITCQQQFMHILLLLILVNDLRVTDGCRGYYWCGMPAFYVFLQGAQTTTPSWHTRAYLTLGQKVIRLLIRLCQSKACSQSNQFLVFFAFLLFLFCVS